MPPKVCLVKQLSHLPKSIEFYLYIQVPNVTSKMFISMILHTIRYDTIGEFNVDWKAEYSALSSTRSQKKKLKQPTPVPL